MGPLAPEACRRLACDGAVTRVVVARQPSPHPSGQDEDHPGGPDPDHHDPTGPDDGGGPDPGGPAGSGLAARLQTAMARLPAILGGAASQPLDLGRTTRVVTPSQRLALAVRDRGCLFPGCDRPLAWWEAHHLWHWLDGGPTDLANLVLVCRAHHRAVHEGGWQLTRGPDGRLTTSRPHRRHQHPPHRHHPTAA